ncbi:hypothetical protein RHGRI_030632 [Rhododendron griersonianum]|uniref:Uncharacterized protein n=1 Tax=Rhododendron griersonianum TaxID=479676 RepID=A0AAV6IAQ9_9ERIC|nr:hypothetical protein RHGRI_030632 [Rhododendron griersonianum]
MGWDSKPLTLMKSDESKGRYLILQFALAPIRHCKGNSQILHHKGLNHSALNRTRPLVQQGRCSKFSLKRG